MCVTWVEDDKHGQLGRARLDEPCFGAQRCGMSPTHPHPFNWSVFWCSPEVVRTDGHPSMKKAETTWAFQSNSLCVCKIWARSLQPREKMLFWGNLGCVQHGLYLQASCLQWALGCFALPWALLNLAVQVKYVGVIPTLTFGNQDHKCLLTTWCGSAEAEEYMEITCCTSPGLFSVTSLRNSFSPSFWESFPILPAGRWSLKGFKVVESPPLADPPVS